MKNFIKSTVKALVDNPEQVEVIEVKSKNISIFEPRVAKADIGQVIGNMAGLLKPNKP